MMYKRKRAKRILCAAAAVLMLLILMLPCVAFAEQEDIALLKTAENVISKNGGTIMLAGIVLVALIAFISVRIQKSRQQKVMTKKLRQHHDFLQNLYNTLPCGVFQYSYEAPHVILNANASCAKIYGYEGAFDVAGKTPDIVVEKGTADAFQAKFELCEKTAGPIMYTWPIMRRDGSVGYTECVMDVVENEDGKVFQEIFIDVSERTLNEKMIEKRYMKELNRSGKHDEGLLYTACFDITEQILIETDIDVPGIHPGLSVSGFVEGLRFELEDLQTEEAMRDFETRFSVERMKRDYENEKYEMSFDLCRRRDDQIQWLRSDLVLRHNPATGHLMCFDYIWDTTDEHVMNEIIRRKAFADCDGFMSIFLSTGRCLQYKVNSSGEVLRTETDYGKTDAIYALAANMTGTDKDEFCHDTELSVISEHLEKELYYQVYATLRDDQDVRQDKSMTYFYTNKRNGILAVIITDVTEVRAGEVRHAQLLSDALVAAEKADAAKSQFLSRVSHEMRTPLNAIIGFLELARDADAEKTAAYLVSSHIAAKQLLNVINDVLDMSSIESGKLKLANAPFNFKHLISSITNIYGTQCKQKGVQFDTRMTTPMEDWLIGDEMRLNQILMNLIGNAVKFTESGSIRLTISETTGEDDKVFVRFSVEDTGCGMSEQMKERIFKPFEQESATTARKYGGSGLGLSIVKSLVAIMGGIVRVESEPGEGSTFIVDLPFRKSGVADVLLLPHSEGKLHVLVVDDQPSECEYMDLVLNRMEIRHTCVSSGGEALAELERAEKENDMYNVCLVDWRMPEMSGLETTSRIRAQYGREVVVIVVSAYDFQQAGDQATGAGADFSLSKPVFQSSLFDLFMTLTGGGVAKQKDEIRTWDFSGRCVLLVEDNLLNQIVANAFLAQYNIVVEIAENGKIAVDMFTASEPGHYDAILMDIQMPVMDGYEATRAIRESKHPQAKSIGIIAQSADAFSEDVIKALTAGMDAHVAKPIKSDVLAKELGKVFSAERRY